MIKRVITASELRTKSSSVLEQVDRLRSPVTITKRGRAIARIVPIEGPPVTLFGIAHGAIVVHRDIVEPSDVECEASR